MQGSGSLSPHGVLKTNGFSIFRQIEPFGFKNAAPSSNSPWRNEMNAASQKLLYLSLYLPWRDFDSTGILNNISQMEKQSDMMHLEFRYDF